MDTQQVVAALATLPAVRVTAMQNRITMYVPAIDDSVHLVADDVQRVSRIWAPDGSSALEFVIGDGSRIWPLIMIDNDVVFSPEDTASLLDSKMTYSIANMPPLVAYSEMGRDAEAFGRQAIEGGIDYDAAASTLLQIRCFISGAARFGLRPLGAVHWWQRSWDTLGNDVYLPPWRTDPLWTGLVAEAEQAAQAGRLGHSFLRPRPDERNLVAALTLDDFDRLAPDLSIVGLDDEFLQAWRRWIRITPATFQSILVRGVPGAQADVSLYPDGGGGVDLYIPLSEQRRAFLQLRFSVPGGDLAIDEIRIPDGVGGGLFQRLMFNSEQLAAQLGLAKVSVLATNIGSYALANVGVFPRDPELYKATWSR